MIKFPSERPPFYSNVHEKSIRTHRCCGKRKSFDISNYIKFTPRRKWRSAIGTSQILSIPLCGLFVRYESIRHTKLPVQRCYIRLLGICKWVAYFGDTVPFFGVNIWKMKLQEEQDFFSEKKLNAEIILEIFSI